MGGSSGARFKYYTSTVMKIGGPRVEAQGKWLRAHGKNAHTGHERPGLPYVYGIERGQYLMEALNEASVMHATPILNVLQRDVWSQDAEVELDFQEHRWYVDDKAADYWPEALTALKYWRRLLSWDSLKRGLTHGDPTFENCMLRPTDRSLVLIDPTPASYYAPDLIAVDLGKLLQSSLGYERVRNRWHYATDLGWLENFDVNERRAAQYFAIVHFIRLLPYMPTTHLQEMMRVLAQPLLHL